MFFPTGDVAHPIPDASSDRLMDGSITFFFIASPSDGQKKHPGKAVKGDQ